MKTKIIKKFEGSVSYAHRAESFIDSKGYPEHCFFPHGHNLSYSIQVSSPTNETTGMMVSFGDVKKIVTQYITNPWDHSFFVHDKDVITMKYIELLRNEYEELRGRSTDVEEFDKHVAFRVNIFPFPTSIENLTKCMWDILENKFKDIGVTLEDVTLFETPTSGFTISKS